jgi:dUTP pyrophosphatase
MSGFFDNTHNENYVCKFLNNDEKTCSTAFAVLKLYVNSQNPELVELYRDHVANHNNKIRNSIFPDVGFDLFIPDTAYFHHPFETQFLNLQVKTEMIHTKPFVSLNGSNSLEDATTGNVNNVGYLVYPRSSISKTPLMLANQTGVIDPGYRGNLISAIRYLTCPPNKDNDNLENVYELNKYTRLLQIVHPELLPIYVVMVDENELTSSERGDGGFGSTGVRGAIR